MKKKYIDFQKVRMYQKTSFLPKISSRRMGLVGDNGVAAYRSDGGDDDEVEVEEEELIGKIKTIIKKELSTRAKKEDVESISRSLTFLTKGKNDKGEDVDSPFPVEALRAMADEKTGVMKKLIDMGVKIQELESVASKTVESMSVRSQVEKWVNDNKESLNLIKSGSKASLSPLEIRAAETMHFSTVNSGNSPYIGSVEVEKGVNSILRFPNTFWDFLVKGRTGSRTYVWANLTSPEGEAAFIGPGVAKPGISFSIEAETSTAKKIAESAKAGTELLDDIDGMVSFIEEELKGQLFQKLNSTLMDSVGSSTVPTGVKQLSQAVGGSAFTAAFAGLVTTNPTNIDAIRAVVAALRSGKLTGDVTVFINSVDAANMDMSKASDSGVYLIPPFATSDGRTIAGARVVEDNNIPVGTIQAGFMKNYRILIYKDFSVSWGWENDDFTKNLVTAVAEMRIHQFFNTRNTGSFFRDTFANVITAITT